MEIWADAECTRRPSGVTSVVYAQLNRSFVLGDDINYDDVEIVCPLPDVPEDPYAVNWYVGGGVFTSDDFFLPLEPGVVQLRAFREIDIEPGSVFSYGPEMSGAPSIVEGSAYAQFLYEGVCVLACRDTNGNCRVPVVDGKYWQGSMEEPFEEGLFGFSPSPAPSGSTAQPVPFSQLVTVYSLVSLPSGYLTAPSEWHYMSWQLVGSAAQWSVTLLVGGVNIASGRNLVSSGNSSPVVLLRPQLS